MLDHANACSLESIVTIPGWTTLSEAKKRAIRRKLVYESQNLLRLRCCFILT